MNAQPIVLLALSDFELHGLSVREGDRIVVRPGIAISLVRDLPLDYGPVMGADLAGQVRIVTSNRQLLADLASVVGLEPASLGPPPRRRRSHARRSGAALRVIP